MPFFKIEVPFVDYDVFYIEAKSKELAEKKLERERKSGRIHLGIDIYGDTVCFAWDTQEVKFPIEED